MPIALYALAAGAFGIGVTEFVIMGLLLDVGSDLGVSVTTAGTLISGYALGVVVGAPILTILTSRWRQKSALLTLMLIFIAGNAACALAPSYGFLMAARVLTAFAHGTFFGVGSVLAADLAGPGKRGSAIALMFTGLTVANILGVPAGTWLGQTLDWRATFWAVSVVGAIAFIALALLIPHGSRPTSRPDWRRDLRAVAQTPVLLGFMMTILGFAGVFMVFTYIAPMLTEISGFAAGSISPILLIFGGGVVIGNLIGGRLTDRKPGLAIVATLGGLLIVLAAMGIWFDNAYLAVLLTGLMGLAGFATTTPLQAWVLSRATGAGESLAASLNIAAFNIGNALGAWAGGVVIDHGPGLSWLPLVAGLFPLAGILVAAVAIPSTARAHAQSAAAD